jgi:hypothetical protein
VPPPRSGSAPQPARLTAGPVAVAGGMRVASIHPRSHTSIEAGSRAPSSSWRAKRGHPVLQPERTRPSWMATPPNRREWRGSP